MTWDTLMVPNYGTPALTLEKGHGWTVTDEAGRSYTDLLGGIAVNALGHAHPAIIDAVQEQVATLGHVSNLYQNPQQIALAKRLRVLTGKKTLLVNSGTEANEAAAKLVRRRAHALGRADGVILAFDQAFHGRTAASLALTGQAAYQAGCTPLPGQIVHVPFNDVSALAGAFATHDVVGVFAEPIQGEGGIIPMQIPFAKALAEHVKAAKALLVMDEVQTGIGRTGRMFAHEGLGLAPDIITLAKGLGGGLPIGACLVDDAHADHLGPGTHGCTFGGNPIACAAANVVLDHVGPLLPSVGAAGATMKAALEAAGLQVRGAGLLIGIVLPGPHAASVAATLQEEGLLVGVAGANVVRLAPPLIIPERVLLSAVPAITAAVASACPAITA